MSRLDGALRLLSDYMKQGANNCPNDHAFWFRDNWISYKEFYDNTQILAGYLLKNGVQRGDRIAYLMTTRPEFFYLYMAASQLGAIIVGISPRFSPKEMEYVLNDTGASYLFTIGTVLGIDFQKPLGVALANCPTVRKIIVLEGTPSLPNSVAYEEIMKGDYSAYDRALQEREAEVDTDDGMVIVYTSGTSGNPKGALLSQRNVIHTCLIEAHTCNLFDEGTVICNHAPVNHVSGLHLGGMSALVANRAMACLEIFDPAKTLEMFEKARVTASGQVPTMFAMELALPNYDDYDVSSLRAVITAGASAQPALVEQIRKRMCKTVINCMGLSEVGGFITYTPVSPDTPLEVIGETVGKIPPEFELKIVDDNRQEVPRGEAGEIAYRGSVLMKGYWNNAEATAACIGDDGWFYSADIGLIDEDGNLKVVGRTNDWYITGGYNVYPAEVESAIMNYPGVLTVAVVGIPHELMGEVGRAYVVPKPGVNLEGEKMREFLKDYLADYKIPRDYKITNELPLTPLGKVQKKVLLQEVAKEFESLGK